MVRLTVQNYVLSIRVHTHNDGQHWSFSLRTNTGQVVQEVSDFEFEESPTRLELLTVIRALETLDAPSLVILSSASRYLRRGLQFGLAEWRQTDWRWERFGLMVPIRNADLWQRLDRALRFHTIECKSMRIDPPHSKLGGPMRLRRARIADGAA